MIESWAKLKADGSGDYEISSTVTFADEYVRCPECSAVFTNTLEMTRHLIAAPLGHGEGREHDCGEDTCVCAD